MRATIEVSGHCRWYCSLTPKHSETHSLASALCHTQTIPPVDTRQHNPTETAELIHLTTPQRFVLFCFFQVLSAVSRLFGELSFICWYSAAQPKAHLTVDALLLLAFFSPKHLIDFVSSSQIKPLTVSPMGRVQTFSIMKHSVHWIHAVLGKHTDHQHHHSASGQQTLRTAAVFKMDVKYTIT